MFVRKKVIVCKIEAAYGTDPVPAAIDAFNVEDFSITPLKQTTVERNVDKAHFGNNERIPVMEEVQITFKLPIASSGTAGTAPKWGRLLRTCGFGEVLVAVTSATYSPVSAALGSLTIYAYIDGILHKSTGMRGNVGISADSGQVGYFNFTYTGMFQPVTDAALLASPDFTALQTPSVAIPTRMGTMTIDAFAARFDKIELNMNNEVIHNQWMNFESIEQVERKPSGSFEILAPTVAQKDIWSVMRAGTKVVATWEIGTVAGQRVKIDWPAMQITDPAYGEKNKEMTLKGSYLAFPTVAGNDEVAIVAR